MIKVETIRIHHTVAGKWTWEASWRDADDNYRHAAGESETRSGAYAEAVKLLDWAAEQERKEANG